MGVISSCCLEPVKCLATEFVTCQRRELSLCLSPEYTDLQQSSLVDVLTERSGHKGAIRFHLFGRSSKCELTFLKSGLRVEKIPKRICILCVSMT